MKNTLYIIQANWQGPLEYHTTNPAEAWDFCITMAPHIGAHVAYEESTEKDIPSIEAHHPTMEELYGRAIEAINFAWLRIKEELWKGKNSR